MEVSLMISIVIADRLNDGLVIKFQDGKCAFYSAILLYATFDRAEALDEKMTIW